MVTPPEFGLLIQIPLNPAPIFLAFPDNIIALAGENVTGSLLIFAKALLILLAGWLIASLVSAAVREGLKKTDIDNRLAAQITGKRDGSGFPIEEWLGGFVFWLIFLFTLVAFFNALQLEAVSEPLNGLLAQITTFLPKILGAGILAALAWALATLVKLLIERSLGESGLSRRLGLTTAPEAGPTPPDGLAQTLAQGAYWLIFLLFLPSILSTLNLHGTLAPVQSLVDKVLSAVPNILAAVLIGAVGWLIAQVVSRLATNLSASLGINRLGESLGLGSGQRSPAEVVGLLVSALILIPVAITALDALKIEAISQPATAMLNQVLALLPKLFAAVVILALGYGAGRYVAQLVQGLLASLGFDHLFQWLGFNPNPDGAGAGETASTPAALKLKSPSEMGGLIVFIGILLVAALTAVDILQIAALTRVMGVILQVGAQVLAGLVIFTFGLYLANLAFTLITSAGGRQSRLLGHTARIAVLVLVSAMALQQMGIAPNIVNLAFGLLVGGVAVAIALAFGLGGRDIASEQIRQWLGAFKDEG